MARKEIKGPITDNTLNALNHNLIELYNMRSVLQTQINDLVLDAGESNQEVAQARGGHKVLADRLNETEREIEDKHNETLSQLARAEQLLDGKKADKTELTTGLSSKVDKGGNEQVTMSMLAPDIKQAINDGTWDINVNESDLEDNAATFRKRTRLGEIGIITISSAGEIPNFDTVNERLVFPNTFFIVVGKNRYTVQGGVSIDYPNSPGIFIYFDTNTESFSAYSQTQINVSESDILIASLYRTTGSNSYVIGAWLSCPFTIDNVPNSVYFIDELPSDKIPDIASMAFITVGQNAPLPNYVTSERKMYFDSMNIIYKDKRIFINEPTELDFSVFSVAGVVAYFDTKTGEFFYRNQNALTNVPNTAIPIAIRYKYDLANGGKENVLINTEYAVDGKPRFMPYSEGSGKNNKPYVFSVNTLTEDFPDSDLQGIGPGNTLFNYDDDTAFTVYEAYDTNLLDAEPEYISKKLWGYDESGEYPIYEYIFSPLRPYFGASGDPRPFPTITMAAGIHGNETPNVYATYYFFEQIVKNWQDNPVLEYLRHNINFKLIPVVNPYGFTEKTYRNYNDVNLNRNWDSNWQEENAEDKGSSPFSEVETQYYRDFLLENLNAVYHLDIHSRGARQEVDSDSLLWIPENTSESVEMSMNVIEKMTRRWKKKYTMSDVPFHGRTQKGAERPMTKSYAEHVLGIPSCTFEMFSDSVDVGSADDKQVIDMNCDALGQYIVSVIKRFQ